jgi:DNA-binding MarR family transcriptional regulator
MAAAGLTAPQFTTLSLLAGMGPMGVTQLAARLGTDRTTLTRNLARLAAMGTILPAPGTDRRQNIWAIAPEGRRRLAAAMPAWRDFQGRLVASLGEGGAEGLAATLSRLAKAAQPGKDPAA